MSRKRYTDEFKQDALNLVRERKSFMGAARELGLRDSVLHTWAKKYNFSIKASAKQNQEYAEQSEEIRKLRKENEDLKKVNYILKKAAAFFCQDQLK